MANIAEILKKCPSGTKLYSPICGECHLYWVADGVRVNGAKADGEIVVYDNDRSKYSFYKDGTQHPMGECLLFPSKENRDWSVFNPANRFRKGDFLKDSVGNIFICDKVITLQMPLNYVGDSFCTLFSDGTCNIGEWLWTDITVVHADEEEKQKLLAAIGEKGYVWDAEKLELRKKEPYIRFFAKKEPGFKPFDKVLVRDYSDDVWKLAQYAFEDRGTKYKYNTVGGTWWAYCIPYEGNEHLLGTNENCE